MTKSEETPVYLAADCGGTNCRVRLYDEDGNRLAEGFGGPSNAALGLDVALSEIFRATREALGTLDGEVIPLSRLHAGLAIAGLVDEKRREEFCHIPHPFASMAAETDAYVTHLGALGGGDGGILIAGTGTSALVVKGGEKFYIGGWGFAVSDQGSGARLGHLSVRYALQAYDGIMPPSPFCDEIMAHVGPLPQDVTRWASTARPADYGALAKVAFDHATRGDFVAESIVGEIAEEIKYLAAAMLAHDIEEIYCFGGLIEPIFPWLDEFVAAIFYQSAGDVFDGALHLIKNRTGLINKTNKGQP